jgi:hypothetical protein
MKMSDSGNKFLSATFESAGKYFLVSQPAQAGIYGSISRPIAGSSGMETNIDPTIAVIGTISSS